MGNQTPLEPRLIQKLGYKLRLNPQLVLSTNLLQMPLLKLKEFVEEELEENPLLEAMEAEAYNAPRTRKRTEGLEGNINDSLSNPPLTLQEHLLNQFRLLVHSDMDHKIGEVIINNIDNDGYFRLKIEDICAEVGVTSAQVEHILWLIQSLDPIGVGARDLRECLLLQLRALGQEKTLTAKVVDKYLAFLEKKRFNYIAKILKVQEKNIKQALKEIARLEPKPGRAFGVENPIYLVPDAILQKTKDGYEIMPNSGELPQLTLNNRYKKMLKQKNTAKDVREYLKERLSAAHSLISAIARRKETINKVIKEIVRDQKEFLDDITAGLKPLTLEQIARKVGMHKSTISRAVNGKYLQTPYGIFELRLFFSPGVKQKNGPTLSSQAIKSRILGLISTEDKENPLSDERIVHALKTRDGINISRRAITKYRKTLKILSSKSRRT